MTSVKQRVIRQADGDLSSKRPWPRSHSMFACSCWRSAPKPSEACAGQWIRCNTRLRAIRIWQWDEETRRGIPHPPGVRNPRGLDCGEPKEGE